MIGIILLALGLYQIKTLIDPQGFMKAFSYICIGLGCGFFGHGMGNVVSNKAIKTNPQIQKQFEIDKMMRET